MTLDGVMELPGAEAVEKDTAELLAADKVVGWAQGLVRRLVESGRRP